jgi:hypothetical protein
MDDNKEQNVVSSNQATFVEKPTLSLQAVDARIDAKLQGIRSELKQVSQLVENIKNGSRRTEEILQKELDFIKIKQTKIDKPFQSLDKIVPVLKDQRQLVSNASISNVQNAPVNNLQKGIQQFTGQTFPLGVNKSLIPNGNIRSPDISSLIQGIAQPRFGMQNQAFPFLPIIQSFMGGMRHERSFGMPMPFGGFSITNRFQGNQEFPYTPHARPYRDYEKSPIQKIIPQPNESYEDTTPPSTLGQKETPLPSFGKFQEKNKSIDGPLPIPKEKQPQVQKQPSITPNVKSYGWWTPERQQHAVDRLMKEGELSEMGARGLVSRWSHVEASGGPGEINSIGATGIGQWLGNRKKGLSNTFDGQITHVINELKSSEKRAGKILHSAKTPEEGAIGASMYERAEGYNSKTGTDYFTDRTIKYIPSISGPSSNFGASLTKLPSLAGQESPKLDTGQSRLKIIGNTANNGVNKDLIKAATEASKHLPEGWRVEAISGFRKGSRGLHGTNDAIDFAIYDDKGKKLSNYQNPQTFRIYEKFSQDSHKALSNINPELAKLHRWGGYFSGTLGKTYGAADLMHQDFGGKRFGINERTGESLAMAAGSWQSGLTKKYHGYFDTPDQPSVGMGSLEKYNYSDYNDIKQKIATEKKDEGKLNYDRLTPEGQTINEKLKPENIPVKKSYDYKSPSGKVEYSRLTSEGKEIDYTPKKEYTPKDIVKQLNQYQTNLLTRLDDLAKQKEIKSVEDTNKKDQARLTIPKKEFTERLTPEGNTEQGAMLKPPMDIRLGQIKNFAITTKTPTVEPVEPLAAVDLEPKSKIQPLKQQTSTIQQQGQIPASQPKWVDQHITPSKSATSKEEISYIKHNTGKDSNFNSASIDTNQ